MERVVLPSRAFLMSWEEQTIPMRLAAIEDAVALFDQSDHLEIAQREMALLALIADAMQCLEDFAYLATGWTEPFSGLANYVKATTYSGYTPTSFWQRIHKRDDAYFDALAGYSVGRDGEVVELLAGLGAKGLKPEELQALEHARSITVERLRRVLMLLADDWAKFSDYFHAYKHGGLTVHRDCAAWVEDDVAEVDSSTPRKDPSLAVWIRRSKRWEGRAVFGIKADEIAKLAAGSGRLAADLCSAFVVSRSAVFESLELDDSGAITALKPSYLAWTIWLREQDLAPETWKLIGRGPTIRWEGASGKEARLPIANARRNSAAGPSRSDARPD